MRNLWIAIVVLMFATVGHADSLNFITGSKLLSHCESDSLSDQRQCIGYLAGVSDITNAYAGMEMIHPMHCLPDGANLGQLQKVAIKGLNEMPEKLHEGAAGLALIVLIKAFPCD